MNTKNKIVLILAAVSIAASLLFVFVLHTIASTSFHKLEHREAESIVNRIESSLQAESDFITAISEDFAAAALHCEPDAGCGKNVCTVSLEDDLLATLGINFVVFKYPDDSTFYAKGIDIIRGASIAIPNELSIQSLGQQKKNGIIDLPYQVPMIVGMNQLTMDEDGIDAVVIVGRYIDQIVLQKLYDLSGTSFLINQHNASGMDPHELKFLTQLAGSSIPVLDTGNSDSMIVYSHLATLNAKDSLYLRIPIERGIYQVQNTNAQMSFWGVLFISLLFIITIYYLVDRMFLDRLTRLSSSVLAMETDPAADSFMPLSGSDEIASFSKILTDTFTRLNDANSTLQENQEKLHSITSAALDAIIMMDDTGAITFWNQAAETMIGYQQDEILGKNLHSFISTDKNASESPNLASFFHTGTSDIIGKIVCLDVLKKDGTTFPAELSVSSARLHHHWYGVGILRDVTARVKTEEALKKHHEKLELSRQQTVDALKKVKESQKDLLNTARDLQKFKLAVEQTSEHIVITDADGMILYANNAVKGITGFHPENVIGQKAGSTTNWGGLMPKELYVQLWKTIKEDKQIFTGELINKRASGAEYTTLASIAPVLDEKGDVQFFVGIERDITQEKKHERFLREFAAIVSSTDDAIIEKNLDGIIMNWNQGAEKLYGYKAEQVIGRSINIIIPEEKRAELENILEDIKNGTKVSHMQTQRLKKDGTIVEVSITISPVYDENGKIIGASSIARDNTHEKEIDRAKTEFVSLASHQLRTPLTAISWYAEMLINGDAGELSTEQSAYLKEISQSNQRMIELVNSLLNVSRIDLGTFSIDPTPTDLIEVAESVISETSAQFNSKKMNFIKSFPPQVPLINLDKKLIRMVFQNLITNAVKYTPNLGTIELAIKLAPKELTIMVRDTGYGIPQNAQDKIFTKLFRADNVKQKDVEGNGLGLYMVKSIIEKSGGAILFTSKENEGTTFIITLPLTGMTPQSGTRSLT